MKIPDALPLDGPIRMDKPDNSPIVHTEIRVTAVGVWKARSS